MKSLIQIDIDNSIYPKQAVLDAKTAFAPYADTRVVPTKHGVTLIFSVKPNYDSERRQVFLEFMNYLLDRVIQIKTGRESQ